MLTRWIVLADGHIVGFEFSEKSAWKLANRYAYECQTQDEPVFPVMTVECEVIE